jgi:hypothetical protein
MKNIKLNFDEVSTLITFVNHYFKDDFFIEVVSSKNRQQLFREATYDTYEECIAYLDLFFDTFDEYVEEGLPSFIECWVYMVESIVEERFPSDEPLNIPDLKTEVFLD